MKKILILLQLILILTLSSCGGYKSVYSAKSYNFNITSIEIIGNKQIGSNIKNALKIFSNVESNNQISIKITSTNTISITSKDSKGDPKTYAMTINSSLEISQNDIKMTKSFTETFGYNNKSNKFDLKKYERNIQNNLTEKITENITLYLSTI
tara:strand:+ start:844 stop:1302 length:459 start_codon:yes stop_codon:yes gene_type:complete